MAADSNIVTKDKLHNFFEGPTIRVRVGDVANGNDGSTKLFTVHKDLMTARSLYFANALKEGSPWASAEDGIVTLKEEDPRRSVSTPASSNKSILEQASEEYEALAKLYGLCDMLQDVQAKNRIITAFVEASLKERGDHTRWYPWGPQIRSIYELTPTSDPLRKFCVDMFVIVGHKSWFAKFTFDQFPAEFLYDVVAALVTGGERPKGRKKIEVAENYFCKIDGGERA
ncbi:hypothetical protein CC80DRAFT_554465 [Byssothecium circinans]|uniref:BTB domain-containing protein n=1 Tax=Byssothecium circinans TaxID=147558 RepID=A0A6A5TDG0_9PLEO|nr:hypothetical protein CC80DRAFT_554465 [Byssothecium circinans]